MRSSPSSNPVSHHSTIIYDEEEEEYDDGDPKNHAVWILVSHKEGRGDGTGCVLRQHAY